ncbi:putative HTH-type transcriptional regulator YdjF [Clostridium zeae]|uniref:HTH-type transcriptional regulator YdjF n=1 Tax=Clostridium zeae TaxID=2759022 RepID=A0ABQ1E773_9CLOT|nr:DeoR/GlpR family DNA-binding transcription regulator [Clostridium zeae]GFZ30627.1 putative HTH-type transcriptional regulator YdjF [Clostridium zeae]
MFAAERLRIIKSILLDKKHINVTSLSSMLNVTEVTIRRDLEKLESEGFLSRTHGGAILNETASEENIDIPLSSYDPLMNEREEISNIASHMIDDNDVILLSPGLTNLHIAKKLLSKKNITVLTNDLNIAYELNSNPSIKVIIPGGDLDPSSMTLNGKLTEENLKRFYVSKTFIEVDGISTNRGYTIQGMDKASVIKEMLQITKEIIMVCTYNCFDNIAFYQIGSSLDIANKIITNPNIPDNYKNYFFDNNIKLYTAFNSYEGGI